MKKVEALLEKVIFASRWILAPFYLGLSLSLLVLLYEFGREIVHFFTIIHETDIAGVLLFILSLVDISLAANLLIIVIFSGYENFVSKIHVENHEDKPEWMGHVDFTDLKIKLISYVVVHLTFVVSGVLLAMMDYIMNRSVSKHSKSKK
jgi:uncharacterized protein (TIGR00645 family)